MNNFRKVLISAVAFLAVLMCLPKCFAYGSSASGTQVNSAPAAVRSKNVQVQLKDILKASEYNRDYAEDHTPKWLTNILEQISKTVVRFMKWIFNSLTFSGLQKTGKIVSFVFACIVITVFILLLILIIRKLRNLDLSNLKTYEEHEIENYELPSSKPMISEAAKLAEGGDYRGAFRCAYLASISYLDEIEVLRFERSRTNWEYLRDLRKGGKEVSYKELKPVTLDFDRVFYGNSDCSKQEYLKAVEAYNRIRSEEAA